MKGLLRALRFIAVIICVAVAIQLAQSYLAWSDRASTALSTQLNSGHPEGPPVPERIEALGQYGDSFGVLTSYMTGFTFLLIFFTTLLQIREFAMQREENRQARLAAEAGRLAQEDAAVWTAWRTRLEYTQLHLDQLKHKIDRAHGEIERLERQRAENGTNMAVIHGIEIRIRAQLKIIDNSHNLMDSYIRDSDEQFSRFYTEQQDRANSKGGNA